MKRWMTLALALALTLSLAACGDKPAANTATPPATSAPVVQPSSAPVVQPSSAPEAPTSGEYTPEQQASAADFDELITRFNEASDAVNADENLVAMQELVDIMNQVGASIEEATAYYADPAILTAEMLGTLDEAVTQSHLFLDQIEAMVLNYGGQEIITVPVEVVNDTGVDIYGLAMSPSNSDSWGDDLLAGGTLANGSSGVSEMSFTEGNLVWDLLAMDGDGNTLAFAGIDFSEISTEGATLMLTAEGDGYVAGFVTE